MIRSLPSRSPLSRIRLALAAAAVGLGGASAVAQETGTPVFSAPVRTFSRHELGLSISSPEGADLGLEGFAGIASGRGDWAFRLGFVDRGRGTDLVLGGRYRAPLLAHSGDFPLDGALIVGLGASFDDGTSVLRVPIGLSLGRAVDIGSSDVRLTPFLQPVLIPTFREDDNELALCVGLGLDLQLARQLDLRVSGALGDLEGFAVGVVWVR